MYTYTNFKGQVHYLKKTVIEFPDDREPLSIYFFSKKTTGSKGEPCDLPEGYEVVENPRNGYVVCRKKKTTIWDNLA